MDTLISKELFQSCNLCPRSCGVNRLEGMIGYCRVGSQPMVASILLHRGEEPILTGEKGICNVFFAHCNLMCDYCQNYQISRNENSQVNWLYHYDEIVEKIVAILKKGIRHLGFVSPTHQVVQMVEIIERIKAKGLNPIIVYNTNSYDNPDIIKKLDEVVDVYLPDIKYYSNELAVELSIANNYFKIAIESLTEMVRQKGTSITLGDDGLIDSGVVVRHLVLPEHYNDSISVLKALEEEFSNKLCISLMSQFSPTPIMKSNERYKRPLMVDEYTRVVDFMNSLGFFRGYFQDMESNSLFVPDFSSPSPFEK